MYVKLSATCIVVLFSLSFFFSDKMDKQVLTSSLASKDVSRYTVGVFKEGMIYVFYS